MKVMTVASVAILAGVSACTPQSTQSTAAPAVEAADAFVSINGEYLPKSMLEGYALERTQGMSYERLPANDQQMLRDELINLELLADAGEDEGLAADPNFISNIALQRTKILARTQLQAWLERNPASEEALQALYDSEKANMAQTQHQASHILVDNEERAKEMILKLNNDVDFANLAREHSSDSSAEQGGDLGWFAAEQMVPAFAAAVNALEVGSYTAAPIQTRFGWHVIKLHDRKQTEAPDFDTVRADMESKYREQQVESYLQELRNASTIESANEPSAAAAS